MLKVVRFDARLVNDGSGWQIDWMRALWEAPGTTRDDCKSAVRMMATAIAHGDTPSIPAPDRDDLPVMP